MDIAQYRAINESFRKKFIYRLGGSTGFFSEYNNMILAIHYCLVNGIQFVLESEEANFSSGKGWTEFFLPFCREYCGRWLRKFNYRVKPVYKTKLERIGFNLFKFLHPDYVYTYELFGTIRKVDKDKIYEIESLGMRGSLLDNCSAIHRMVWRYSSGVGEEIRSLRNSLSLPPSFIGLHIRLGDKREEAPLLSPEKYVMFAERFSKVKCFFILTDDYRSIVKLREEFPEYSFFSFCQADEVGYSLPRFMKKPYAEQRQSYLRLWASMDIMEQSVLFVGTFSANPGMNMGFRLPSDRIKCLDYNEWQIW